MINIILLGIMSFVATIIKSISGFGFGIIFMSIASLLIPIKQATILSLSTVFFYQFYIMFKLHKHIRWRLVLIPAFFGVIAGTIGVHVMVKMSAKTMNLILGIFLWLMALFLMFIEPKLKLKNNSIVIGSIAGIFSGFMRALFAAGSPPIAIYYNAVLNDPLEYQATIQTYFNITTVVILFNDILYHNFTKLMIIPLISTIIFCILGTIWGMKLINKISMNTVRKTSYIIMFLAGTYNFIKFFV